MLAVVPTCLPAPAVAADVVVVSRSGKTAGDPPVLVYAGLCGDPATPAPNDWYTVSRVTGPATPPRGVGSASIQQKADHEFGGVAFLFRPAAETTTWRAGFRIATPVPVISVLFVTVSENGSTTTWRGGSATAALPTNTWTTVDAMTLDHEFVPEGPGDPFTGTLAEFVAAHPGATNVGGFLGAGTCDSPVQQTVHVDDVRVSAGTDTQIIDFEPRITSSATNSATPTTIVSGQSSVLSTRLTGGGAALASEPVQLFEKPAGATSYSLVASATTSSTGVAKLTVKPTRNTSYQWRYAGDETNQPTNSATKTVGVHTKVTIGLADATLHPGQTLVARGRVSPVKGGVTITLWRHTTSGNVKLGTGTIKADGTYRIAKTLSKKGSYTVFTTVPAVSGNLNGTSPKVTAKVG